MKTFAVPPPGVEMGAQALDIGQRFRADFVISHLFGGAPSVSIKELKRVGYPMAKVIGLVWASAEANIEGAGGFAVAEGYHAMQFAGVGSDYPVLQEIRDMYKKQGKEPPKEMASTVFYNRGVLIGALHIEAIRNAVKAKGGAKITGADVKEGFEKITQLHAGGARAAAQDHAAGPRGRRARADLAGEGRQVREGDRVVRRLSERGGEAHQGVGREEVAARARPALRCRARAAWGLRALTLLASRLCRKAPALPDRRLRRATSAGRPEAWRTGERPRYLFSVNLMLTLNNVEVIYDGVILVLKGVSITCGEGKITTLLGANGAGKTTTLKAISGLLRSERGDITKGSVELAGQRIDHCARTRSSSAGSSRCSRGGACSSISPPKRT